MRIEKLGDVGEIVRGSSPRPQGDPRFYGGPIPRLMLADVTRDGMYVTPSIDSLTEEGASKSRPMKKGDLIIAVSGDPGRPCILNIDACIHDGFVGIRNLNPEKFITPYLYYFLSYFRNSIKKGAVGAIFQNLTTTQIKEIKVPFLSLIDQQKIVNLLSRAETLLTQRKESLQLLDVFLESTFYEMFGDPVKNEKKWEKQLLKDVCSKIGSGATPRGGKENYKNTGISLIRSLNVFNNEFSLEQLAFIDDVQAESLDNVIVESGDVLLNITGASVARCCIVPDKILPARVNQHVAILRVVHKLIDPVFLNRLITNPSFQSYLIKNAKSKGATREAITKDELDSTSIISPPIDLQKQFASVTEKVELLKVSLSESLGQLENLFASLNQKSFDGELNLDKLSPRTLEASVEEKASVGDELDITIIKTEPPKQEVKSLPYQTLKPVTGKVAGYKPKADDLLLFIQQSFGEDFFTFPLLKDKAIEAGWSYDFEQLKTYVFNLLREGKLQQVFTDAAFEERMREVNEQYQKPTELTEKLHLQRAVEL